jgi:hypothetical protein
MSKYPIGIGFLTPATPERLRYMAQMGATHVVTSLPAEGRRNRQGDIWAFEGMLAQRKEIESYGLKLSVYEAAMRISKITANRSATWGAPACLFSVITGWSASAGCAPISRRRPEVARW